MKKVATQTVMDDNDYISRRRGIRPALRRGSRGPVRSGPGRSSVADAPGDPREVFRRSKLALTDFVFNLGIGQARESTLFRLVNKRRFAEAALEFERWVYAAGRKLDGLAKLEHGERSLFTR